jgi:hypothetical protein
VRYLGTLLPDPRDVPAVVLDRLAGQLQIADPSCVKRYAERRTTPFEHRDVIKAAYGLREFPEAEAEAGLCTQTWNAGARAGQAERPEPGEGAERASEAISGGALKRHRVLLRA